MDGQLILQPGDPLAGGHQLTMIAAGHAGHLAAAGQLPPPPGINHLGADLQIMRDLRDRPPRSHQIQHFPAEPRRVTSRHNTLLELPDG